MSWDVISCRTIERVIRENPDADLKILRKRISEAYPFGQRKYWPYVPEVSASIIEWILQNRPLMQHLTDEFFKSINTKKSDGESK